MLGLLRRLVVLALVVATGSVAPALAGTTGQIVGVVRAEGGGPLQGVEIRASSPALQGLRTAMSGADGRYVLPILPPGVYALDVSGPNVVAMRLESVEVLLGQTTDAAVDLVAGSLSETVTVTAEPPLVDPNSADTGVTLPRKLLDGLPLATREYRELAKLVPSVTATEINMTSGKGQGFPSFRGEGQFGDNYLVDGLTGRDVNEFSPGTPVPIGAIQEVQLISDGFAPEYGQYLGGLVNVVTRSGSNEFGGEVSYLYTSDGLSSEAEPTILAQPIGSKNAAPRFDLGGPILKDRLWYFASYDGVSNETTFASSDLPGLGTLPSGTEDLSGFNAFAKLTALLAPGHTLTFNYSRQETETTGLNAATAFPEARPRQKSQSERYRLNYQAIIGPATVLELKGGYVRNTGETFATRADDVAAWEVVTYGVTMNNAMSLGSSRSERTDLAATLSHVWNPGGRLGSHQLKVGLEHHLPKTYGDGRLTGSATDVITTGQNPIAPDYGLADTFDGGSKLSLLAVDGPGGTILAPAAFAEYRHVRGVENSHREWGLFLQDEWSLGRWTVMAGVRADSQKSTDDTGRVFSEFGFKDSVAPRASLAWDLTGEGSQVIKAGWGRFYDVNSLAYSGFANSAGPVSLRTYQWAGAPADQDFRDHLGDGSAYDAYDPDNWAFSFEQSTLIPFDYSGVKRPNGGDRWLLEYDRRLPRDMALKLRHVDHRSRGLIEDVNSLDASTFFRFVVQDTRLKRRDFTSDEIEVTGRPWKNVSLGGSYVRSRSRGTDPGNFETGGFGSLWGSSNYIGVYLDAPPSDPAFWCTFFGPTCVAPDWNTADPRLDYNNDDRVDQVDYDLSIQNLFTGLGNTQDDQGWYGPLPYAVDNLVKIYGRWDIPRWGMYLGWYGQWGSGYHMSRRSFVRAYGDFLGFQDTPHYEFTGACTGFADCEATLVTAPEEKGSGTRGTVDMPSFWSLDLTVGKLWNLRGRYGFEMRADILNVFDRQPVLTIADRATDTWGQPYSRQAPRSVRLYGTMRF